MSPAAWNGDVSVPTLTAECNRPPRPPRLWETGPGPVPSMTGSGPFTGTGLGRAWCGQAGACPIGRPRHPGPTRSRRGTQWPATSLSSCQRQVPPGGIQVTARRAGRRRPDSPPGAALLHAHGLHATAVRASESLAGACPVGMIGHGHTLDPTRSRSL